MSHADPPSTRGARCPNQPASAECGAARRCYKRRLPEQRHRSRVFMAHLIGSRSSLLAQAKIATANLAEEEHERIRMALHSSGFLRVASIKRSWLTSSLMWNSTHG